MRDTLALPEDERHRLWDRWFRRTQREFCPLLLPFAGQPVTYIETGCWAGASGEWVAKNILTHPDSRGFGIDPYFPMGRKHPQREIDAIQHRAKTRVAAACGDRWKWIQKPSAEALRRIEDELNGRPVDIYYIDGDHDGHAVVQDFALVWPFLRVGSVVIFDDYLKRRKVHVPHVVEGYNSILTSWRGLIETIKPDSWHHRQRAVRVVKKAH